MTDADEDNDDRLTVPPDPNTTPADVLRALGKFKKELFKHLDEQEVVRDRAIDLKLENRDANVLTHVRELRAELRDFCNNVDDLTWWRSELRRNRHGIRNSMLAIIGAIGDIQRRVHMLDGMGADVSELNDLIARELDYKNNDGDKPPRRPTEK